MSIETLKQALEFCEFCWRDVPMNEHAFERTEQAITALRAAIEQMGKQEPLGYWLIGTDHVEFEKHGYHDGPEWEAVYTQSPPAAPVQEPVAIVSGYYGGQCVVLPTNPARLFNSGTAFYTTPPAAQPAVPLTDEKQIAEALRHHGLTLVKTPNGYTALTRWQIDAHGITAPEQKGN